MASWRKIDPREFSIGTFRENSSGTDTRAVVVVSAGFDRAGPAAGAALRQGMLDAAKPFIGGVPAKLVPDNLKSGVTDASYYDPVLNRSYHELARHYEVAVPARVRKPRDKPSVEGGVRLVEQWVLAPLRHRQFFSLAEANVAIVEKITEWNDRPFAPPREGCRRSLFEAIERAALKPLPAHHRPVALAAGQRRLPRSPSTITLPRTRLRRIYKRREDSPIQSAAADACEEGGR